MKQCSKCKEIKPLDDFYTQKSGKYAGKPTSWCRPCSSTASRAYYHSNPEKSKEAHARWVSENQDRIKIHKAMSAYGITKSQYEALAIVCEICNTDEGLCIDHDHESGTVRGRLCHGCNKALGFFKDDVALLRAAIKYLEG